MHIMRLYFYEPPPSGSWEYVQKMKNRLTNKKKQRGKRYVFGVRTVSHLTMTKHVTVL